MTKLTLINKREKDLKRVLRYYDELGNLLRSFIVDIPAGQEIVLTDEQSAGTNEIKVIKGTKSIAIGTRSGRYRFLPFTTARIHLPLSSKTPIERPVKPRKPREGI